ncbi:hypothetical protein RIF29_27426 [Crotalaria pallida]|uniref:Uncharacterized protein n=1 Tax=Crotalaria pallida TaxID=3830 RepID=A0AAN9EP18_CROPI
MYIQTTLTILVNETEILTRTRRRRVPARSEVVGPVNINWHDDDDIWDFNMSECKYDDCGDPEFSCRWCGAKFWLRERLALSSKTNPVYSLCCGSGKVQLPLRANKIKIRL